MTAFLIVIYSICGVYLLFNLKHDIQMLQQNSYRIPRYWRYLQKNDIGNVSRLVDVALIFIVCSRLLPLSLALFLTGVVCLVKIFLIFGSKYKLPLKFTKRVIRIYSVAGLITIGLCLWAVFMMGFSLEERMFYMGPALTICVFLLIAIFSWIIVIISIIILMPVEKLINRRYWNDASRILKGMKNLTVIGITGSYGKTSTKHFLNTILAEKYPVLMTPGSFNTTMGVIRTVREMMKPYFKVFICEMGAKQKGDIKEICDLVHPSIGIVTAVGPMHLETFKSLDNIQSTKFELIDSLPADGLAVINNDFEKCAERKVENVEVMRYSLEDGNDALFKASISGHNEGFTIFNIKGPDNFEIELETRLIGDCNISNITAAVVVALRMGLSTDEIKRGVARIQPVEHRLSVSHTPSGITIIDDAYNSNPEGSKMALKALGEFKNGKRIVVTPGMIELGSKQYSLNRELGESIAVHCDVAIIVGNYNREAITEGLREGDFNKENIYPVDNFNEAQKVLAEIAVANDTVLYENDLPDTFK